MVNKPQHRWQSFKAVHKPLHHTACSVDTTGSVDGAGARAPAAPCVRTPNEQQSFLQAYVVSTKTGPNLTVYSLHFLLGSRSGGVKTAPVPLRASHVLVIVIVLLSLLGHPVQKAECKEFLQ